MSDIIDVDSDDSPYDYDWGEPNYKVWKDDQGIIHVEVDEGWSEYVIWDIKKGKMVKTFDSHEVPF